MSTVALNWRISSATRLSLSYMKLSLHSPSPVQAHACSLRVLCANCCIMWGHGKRDY